MCSKKLCSDLGWNVVKYSGGEACAESDRNFFYGFMDECYHSATYSATVATCKGIGARLCTKAELYGNVARDTGCQTSRRGNYDHIMVWSADTCALSSGGEGILTTQGAKLGTDGYSSYDFCHQKTTGATYPTRCCADVLCGGNKPTDIKMTGGQCKENAKRGTQVATFAAVDKDTDDTHTFALGSGTAQFRLIGNVLKTKKKLNYEVDGNEIEIIVRVSDADANVFTKTLVIKVSDENDSPGLAETVFAASEKSGKGDLVAALQVADDDILADKVWLQSRTPQEHSVSLATSGTPFYLEGTKLYASADLDYETAKQWKLKVTVADNGSPEQSASVDVNIMVQDEDDTPAHVMLSKATVAEVPLSSGAALGGTIGEITAYDEDIELTPHFGVVSDPSNPCPFGIAGDPVCSTVYGRDAPAGDAKAGSLVSGRQYKVCKANLVTISNFVYPGPERPYKVVLVFSDQNGAQPFPFNITITNVNDDPTDLIAPQHDIVEHSPEGLLVTELIVVDPDDDDTHTFKLENADESPFKIVGSELVVADPSKIDFETSATIVCTITATDSGSPAKSLTRELVFNVVNKNEAPSSIRFSNPSFSEMLRPGDEVTRVVVDDPDNYGTSAWAAGTTQTHECLLNGPNADLFALDTVDGHITMSLATDSIDYERKAAYTLMIACEDDGEPRLAFAAEMAITVANANEAPTAILLSGDSVAENSPAGTMIGSLTTTDPDNAGANASQAAFRYSFVDTDGVTDGREIGTIHDDDYAFAVLLVDGAPTLVTRLVLDYEHQQQHDIYMVVADEGGETFEAHFTIAVQDVNDVPTDVSLSEDTVNEGETGAEVGKLTTEDEDVGQQHTYAIVDPGKTDGHMFVIEGDVLKLLPGVAADYEYSPTLGVRISSTDNGQPFARSVIEEFVIHVKNTNEQAQVIFAIRPGQARTTASTTVVVDENPDSGEVVATLVIQDPDNPQLPGQAAGEQTHECKVLNVTSALAAIQTDLADQHADKVPSFITKDLGLVVAQGDLNYESAVGSVFTVQISCTDDGSPPLTVEAPVTVQVKNVNEAPAQLIIGGRDSPPDTLKYAISVPENAGVDFLVGNLKVVDPDNCRQVRCTPVQTHTIRIVETEDAPVAAIVDGSPLSLQLLRTLDYEAQPDNPVVVRISVTDDGEPALSTVFQVSIEVTDENDAPTAIGLSGNGSLDYLATPNTVVGKLFAEDEDATGSAFGQHTFELSGASVVRGGTTVPISTDPSVFKVEEDGTLLYAGNGDKSVFRPGAEFVLTIKAMDGGVPSKGVSADVAVFISSDNLPSVKVKIASLLSIDENIGDGHIVSSIAVSDPLNAPGCARNASAANAAAAAEGGAPAIQCAEVHLCSVGVTKCSAQSNGGSCPVGTAGPFAINQDDLSLIVSAASGLNFEQVAAYTLTVSCAAKGEELVTAETTVAVQDANEPPTAIRLVATDANANTLAASVAEGASDGVVVGYLECDDPDSGQQHTFALASGAAGQGVPFKVENGNTLVVSGTSLEGYAPIDYEILPTIKVTINATDSGSPAKWITQLVEIDVVDVNEAPTDLTLECGCKVSPCQNAGSCIPIGNDGMSFQCRCTHGFAGTYCDINLDPSATLLQAGPESSKFTGRECLIIHPSTSVGSVLANVKVADEDAAQLHTVTISGPGSSMINVVKYNGVSTLMLASTSTTSQSPTIDIVASDPGGLKVGQSFVIEVSTCGGGVNKCSMHASCSETLDEPVSGVTCTCNPGYVGDGETCSLQLCNGGACTACNPNLCRMPKSRCLLISGDNEDGGSTGGKSVCSCPRGFGGENCDVKQLCTADADCDPETGEMCSTFANGPVHGLMAMCLKRAAIVATQGYLNSTVNGGSATQLRNCIVKLAQVDPAAIASVSQGVVVLGSGDSAESAIDAADIQSAITSTCASASASASASAENRECCFALEAAVPTAVPRTTAARNSAQLEPSAQESAAAAAAAAAVAAVEREEIQESLGSAAGTAGGIAGALFVLTALAIIFAQWKKRQGSAPLHVTKDPRSGGGVGSKKKSSATIGTPQRKAVSFVNPAYASATGSNQSGRITPGFAHLSEGNGATPSLDEIEKGYLAIGEEEEEGNLDTEHTEQGYIQVGNPLFVSSSPPSSPRRAGPPPSDGSDYESDE